MKRRRVYLPKWQRWFIVPFFVGMWGFLTYMEFFNEGNADKMGVVGYGFMTILFLGLALMMYMMTSGRLPAYEVEEDEEKRRK